MSNDSTSEVKKALSEITKAENCIAVSFDESEVDLKTGAIALLSMTVRAFKTLGLADDLFLYLCKDYYAAVSLTPDDVQDKTN